MKPKPQKSWKDFFFFFLHVGLSQQDFGSRTCLSSLFLTASTLILTFILLHCLKAVFLLSIWLFIIFFGLFWCGLCFITLQTFPYWLQCLKPGSSFIKARQYMLHFCLTCLKWARHSLKMTAYVAPEPVHLYSAVSNSIHIAWLQYLILKPISDNVER